MLKSEEHILSIIKGFQEPVRLSFLRNETTYTEQELQNIIRQLIAMNLISEHTGILGKYYKIK